MKQAERSMMKNVMLMMTFGSIAHRGSCSYELLVLHDQLSELHLLKEKKKFDNMYSLAHETATIRMIIQADAISKVIVRENLLQFDARDKLVAYYLSTVKVYNPATQKTIFVMPQSVKYQVGDVYQFDPVFGNALDTNSEKFKEFTPEAQNEIRAFNKAIDELWPIVQKLRKEAGMQS